MDLRFEVFGVYGSSFSGCNPRIRKFSARCEGLSLGRQSFERWTLGFRVKPPTNPVFREGDLDSPRRRKLGSLIGPEQGPDAFEHVDIPCKKTSREKRPKTMDQVSLTKPPNRTAESKPK